MSLFLYNVFLLVYRFVILVASQFKEKARLWVEGRENWFQKMESRLAHNEKRIWIHCSSLGEFEQGRPLMESIKLTYPDHKIVLTFFSPSGYQIRKDYDQADYVFYLPMDSAFNAKRFLHLVKPGLAIFVKYEFWFYYLDALREANICTVLVSATFRSSQSFFKWYGSLFRRMLGCFTYLFVQDEQSAGLLEGLGLGSKVFVSGDTRYDRVGEIALKAREIPFIDQWKGQHRLLIAGSTWASDEEVLKKVWTDLPSDWKLVIAPHEIHKAHIRDLERLFGPVQKYSDLRNTSSSSSRVLLIDNMGMLSSLFRYGDIAFIGGGFQTGGIHNTLEPAVFGLPVIFGPRYEKFVEAVMLVQQGYGYPVRDAAEFSRVLDSLIGDLPGLSEKQEGLRELMREKTGATEKILKILKKEIN